MIGRRGRLFAVGLAAVAVLSGCGPVDEPINGKRQPLPPGEPSIAFVVRAYNANLEEISRPVARVLTSVTASGQPGHVVDLDTGRQRPSPYDLPPITTPVRTSTTLLPGVVAISVSVRMTGGRKGDIITCYVEQNGQELPGTRDASQQKVSAVIGGVGVSCEFIRA